MTFRGPHKMDCCDHIVVHDVECRHRVEVEVWPPNAEVYYNQDRYVDPVNTQVQFDAAVYNGSSRVTWSVKNIHGGPGAGTINPSGLYTSPPTGIHGTTDVVTATPTSDPTRKAFAFVTLIGRGPEPAPEPKIIVYPKQAYLYYPPQNMVSDLNRFIDASNTMQLFRVDTMNANGQELKWEFSSLLGFTYDLFNDKRCCDIRITGTGVTNRIDIKVSLENNAIVYDDASFFISNYKWPLHYPADYPG
ncbi:MAG: hypothetical protein GY847_34485 [Proteobacteria bacterium]|nr:hypothetical protein [Pseudomonadota bacterium]